MPNFDQFHDVIFELRLPMFVVSDIFLPNYDVFRSETEPRAQNVDWRQWEHDLSEYVYA